MIIHDPVASPAHYTVYPVQPIAVARHLPFCLGNAVKYVLRAPHRGGAEDLRKALAYLVWERETPGPALQHHIYARVEAAIDGIVNHLVHPSSEMVDLQVCFLMLLDRYLAGGEREALDAMTDAVGRMLELPGLRDE